MNQNISCFLLIPFIEEDTSQIYTLLVTDKLWNHSKKLLHYEQQLFILMMAFEGQLLIS